MKSIERSQVGIELDRELLDGVVQLDDGKRCSQCVGAIQIGAAAPSNPAQLDNTDPARHQRAVSTAQELSEGVTLFFGEKQLDRRRRIDVEQGLVTLAGSKLLEHLGERLLAGTPARHRGQVREIDARTTDGEPATLEVDKLILSFRPRHERRDQPAVLGHLNCLAGLHAVDVPGEILAKLPNPRTFGHCAT